MSILRLYKEALKYYIEELEDYYLAMYSLENPGKIYTSEEVKKMCSWED